MIDKKTLDAVLPVPSLEELRDAKVEELKNEGFVITNFHSGGVFHTMLMIALRIKIEVIELLRLVLNNMFVSHATGIWLDLKMADYSKKRKKAQKARGLVTASAGNHAQGVAYAAQAAGVPATIVNISAGGVYLRAPLLLEKGRRVWFDFQIGGENLTLSAQVLRSENASLNKNQLLYGYGCKFINMLSKHEAALRSFIFQLQRQQRKQD